MGLRIPAHRQPPEITTHKFHRQIIRDTTAADNAIPIHTAHNFPCLVRAALHLAGLPVPAAAYDPAPRDRTQSAEGSQAPAAVATIDTASTAAFRTRGLSPLPPLPAGLPPQRRCPPIRRPTPYHSVVADHYHRSAIPRRTTKAL